MARLWRIYRTFFASSLVREMEFRANFIASLFHSAGWVAFYLMMILVIFSHTQAIAGWSREKVFLLMGSIFLMSSVHGAVFASCLEIPEQVRRGTLDFVITKPVDSQFWVSFRRFAFNRIGTLIAAVIMIGFGVVQGGYAPSPLQWIAYLLALAIAQAIYYSFNFALMSLAIYFVRVDNLWVLGETTLETARFPIDVYRTGVKDLLVFYIPLGFLATVPARILADQVDWLVLGAGVIWAAIFVAAARWFWNWSLKSYTSASS